MASQEPIKIVKPIKKPELTKEEIQHNIDWFLRRLVSYPLFKGCEPYISIRDNGSGGYLHIQDNCYLYPNARFSERLANVLRSDLNGFFRVVIGLHPMECEVQFACLNHTVIQEIYKWIKYNEDELELVTALPIKGRISFLAITDCAYDDDNSFIDGLSIRFYLDLNDTEYFEEREKCINGALNTIMSIAERRVIENNQRIITVFSEQNILEIDTMMEKWVNKGSFKHSEFLKLNQKSHVFYYASTGYKEYKDTLSRRIRKIINGGSKEKGMAFFKFFYRGIVEFSIACHGKYKERAEKVNSWLKSNASQLGIEQSLLGYFEGLSIFFTNIDGGNYKERLQEIFDTIDKVIDMF